MASDAMNVFCMTIVCKTETSIYVTFSVKCGVTINRNNDDSDQLSLGFQIRFGPEIWPQKFHI